MDDLISRAEARKYHAEHCVGECGCCPYIRDHEICTMFDEMPAADASTPGAGWISVSDRLPEPFISVLIHMTDAAPTPEVREGWLIKDSFYCPVLYEIVPVDYWMPMPEPPKEDKSAYH